MERDFVYGTQFEIMGAAALFGVRVIVHSPSSPVPFAFYGRKGHPYIYLYNADGLTHYDWYEPQRL
jgi:hypothetical protein